MNKLWIIAGAVLAIHVLTSPVNQCVVMETNTDNENAEPWLQKVLLLLLCFFEESY